MGRGEYQKRISKSVILLLVANIIFFGFFGLWIWYDMRHMSGWGISPGAFFFTLSSLVFVIWYGVFSYKKTRKPWLSNIIFLVFEVIFYTFISLTTDISNINSAAFNIYIFTSLSLISSFTAKSKIDKKEKANEKQED